MIQRLDKFEKKSILCASPLMPSGASFTAHSNSCILTEGNEYVQSPAKARRLQVQRLMDLLYDASHNHPNNEDTQLIINNLTQVLILLTGMEWHQVPGIWVLDEDVFRADHIGSIELERYAGHLSRNSLPSETIRNIQSHLVTCSFCRSMMVVFESMLICGTRVRLVAPDRRHYPCFDSDEVPCGPVTLSAGLGIAAAGLRDDQ